MRCQTLLVKLRRPNKNQTWGISIAGGADLGTPIIVTRSENDDLQKGDVIKKIDDYDVRDLRHVDAQTLLQNSESVRLVVERLKTTQHPPTLPKSPVPPPLPVEEEFISVSPDQFNPPHQHIDEIREERVFLTQPYRTTPLVLPGAKIKKDAPRGECYLRHHPNPMMRAAPHHFDVQHPDVAMKQKVVHKQFNSPIGLYSDQNIADSIKCQTSAIPKKPVKYDPSRSEAYKALQEEALDDVMPEVKQPSRTGVFSPNQARLNRSQARPKSPGVHYVPIMLE